MLGREVAQAKVASIRRCLSRIHETTSLDRALLDEIDTEAASKIEKVTGFRNIAIHDYQALAPEIPNEIHHRASPEGSGGLLRSRTAFFSSLKNIHK